MVNTQEWLEENYPNKEVREIYIKKQLEEVLDLSDYRNLEKLFISLAVDEKKFEIEKGFRKFYGGSERTEITQLINVQE